MGFPPSGTERMKRGKVIFTEPVKVLLSRKCRGGVNGSRIGLFGVHVNNADLRIGAVPVGWGRIENEAKIALAAGGERRG